MENYFNEMLEYGEAIKSSFVKGHVSDWPEKVAETPEESNATPKAMSIESIETGTEVEETPKTKE